ncbi:N-acetylmuramoyl-L-alanine amidase [Akkermansia sp. N21116]|uniref:N-acetylmuramoyl-L-alanine amidase family protein n=1 Tax=Akkermansia sp. N21116 TaxID=3040764 RepID=UPI00244EA178|nr:N-acetylmuramoyl-L-alanine amidase [Akkermansia sp. N21116]WPX40122.1 N-acetylmuramoyl-L-alanine amidase [Akkermansia sp. N21116]
MKIAIDIGHANGTGSRGNGMEEHAVATKIGTNLAVMLEEQGHEVDVIDFPNLSNTADINKTVAAVNAGNYDISVSIHCDSSDSPNSCGAHVCYNRTYTKTGDIIDSVKGKALARCIAARITKILPGRADTTQARPDKSKKLSSIAVLRDTRPPAVLVECGFITNQHDAEMMRTAPNCIAQQIALGIKDFAK